MTVIDNHDVLERPVVIDAIVGAASCGRTEDFPIGGKQSDDVLPPAPSFWGGKAKVATKLGRTSLRHCRPAPTRFLGVEAISQIGIRGELHHLKREANAG